MPNLSVVLPTYNEASWLDETIHKLDRAITKAKNFSKTEIIIVDDGSTDNTQAVISNLSIKTPLVYIKQKNQGRFIARKNGVEKAKHDLILFIDSRVHIDETSLEYVSARMTKSPTKRVWNAHVNVYKKGNIYARFWDAVTFIAWRRYFANPRETSYGPEDFDYFPKGTTCFIAPKELVASAINNFAGKSKDSKQANDDTLLIKYIVDRENINISPSFSCTYHGRSTLKKFLKHAYHRGQVFVDGFLRMDGNRYFLPLVGFLLASLALPVFLVIFHNYIMYLLLIILAGWLCQLLIALYIKVPIADALSLCLLTPLFILYYGAGIWVATIRRVL